MSVTDDKCQKTKTTSLSIYQLMKFFKHRYPMLLIDRFESVSDSEAVAIKNVTINEPFFTGHFPEYPVMPGVMTLEAIAQASGGVIFYNMKPEEYANMRYYFASIQSVKFKKPIIPGDVMQIRIQKMANKMNIWKFSGEVFVGSRSVCEAIITNFVEKIS